MREKTEARAPERAAREGAKSQEFGSSSLETALNVVVKDRGIVDKEFRTEMGRDKACE